MGKRIILRLDGSFDDGFGVTLEISQDGGPAETFSRGRLPSHPELAKAIKEWQASYRNVGAGPRNLTGIEVITGSVHSRKEECNKCGKYLEEQFKAWLCSQSFQKIQNTISEDLNNENEFRFLISSQDKDIQRLPWHLWPTVSKYRKSSVSLAFPEFERLRLPNTRHDQKVKILAIFGNQQGINTQLDKEVLEMLAQRGAKVTQLPDNDTPEVTREILDKTLFSGESWDILFFAGHSHTEENQGRIALNENESLSIEDFTFSLREAIARGLQLAIFNSCDGLGLAWELRELNLSQVIIMREPVPDRVAQRFLQYLLTLFSNEKLNYSLHQAVRQARERLKGLESDYPFASWLPIISQHPAAPLLTWEFLRRATSASKASTTMDVEVSPVSGSSPASSGHLEKKAITQKPTSLNVVRVCLYSLAVSSLVMAMRWFGLLEPFELNAYDHLMRVRPQELVDDAILRVRVTKKLTDQYGYPIPDGLAAELLKKLQESEPKAIGLDIHRYHSHGLGREDLIAQFEYKNLFGVCSFSTESRSFSPPAELAREQTTTQLGFSDLVLDNFSSRIINFFPMLLEEDVYKILNPTVRRNLLSYEPSLATSTSSCLTPYSLSLLLSFHYLQSEGVQPLKVNKRQQWEFGNITFHPLSTRFGGYQNLDGNVSETLINYRAADPGQYIDAIDILEGNFDSDLVKDRIILIGYGTGEEARDAFKTPIGTMTGTEIHAHIVSQIIRAVLDGRPMIWVLPQWGSFQWGDGLFVLCLSLSGSILAWKLDSKKYLILSGGLILFALHQGCLLLLVNGGWMPLVPAGLALIGSMSLLHFQKSKVVQQEIKIDAP